MMDSYGASMRQVCGALQMNRQIFYYETTGPDNSVIVRRIKEITTPRVDYGFRLVHVLLRREGFPDNHKRVCRLYREQGLSLRYKRPKRNKAAQLRQPQSQAHAANTLLSLDWKSPQEFARQTTEKKPKTG